MILVLITRINIFFITWIMNIVTWSFSKSILHALICKGLRWSFYWTSWRIRLFGLSHSCVLPFPYFTLFLFWNFYYFTWFLSILIGFPSHQGAQGGEHPRDSDQSKYRDSPGDTKKLKRFLRIPSFKIMHFFYFANGYCLKQWVNLFGLNDRRFVVFYLIKFHFLVIFCNIVRFVTLLPDLGRNGWSSVFAAANRAICNRSY